MIAAATIASDHGSQHILFLTDSRNVAQVFKKEKATDWFDIISGWFEFSYPSRSDL